MSFCVHLQPSVQPHSHRGYTLIETLVAVALTAILLGVGLPSMTRFIGNWQVSDAMNSFTGSLRVARTEAIKRGRDVRMCASTDGATCTSTMNATKGWATGWIIYVDNNKSLSFTSGTDVILLSPTSLPVASILSSKGTTITNFVFRPNGLMTSGVQALDFTPTQGSGTPRGLCVSTTGRTRVVSSPATTFCQANEE